MKTLLIIIISNLIFSVSLAAGSGTKNVKPYMPKAESQQIQTPVQKEEVISVSNSVEVENESQSQAEISKKVGENTQKEAISDKKEKMQQIVNTLAGQVVEKIIKKQVQPKLAPEDSSFKLPKLVQKAGTQSNDNSDRPMRTVSFGKEQIPADFRIIQILGAGIIPREKALAYVKRNAGKAKLNCSVKEIVDFYYDEAETEGVRPDLALCQAILETGCFSFTGTVSSTQNNFCGLGTTGNGVKGAKFDTAQEGVRAHIQHLLAYCQKEKPKSKIVDPRYDLVHKIRMSKGLITNWYGLNGTWAMSAYYCEKIMAQYMAMMRTE